MKTSHNEMSVTLNWKDCTRMSLRYLKVPSQKLQSGTEIGKSITLNCQ